MKIPKPDGRNIDIMSSQPFESSVVNRNRESKGNKLFRWVQSFRIADISLFIGARTHPSKYHTPIIRSFPPQYHKPTDQARNNEYSSAYEGDSGSDEGAPSARIAAAQGHRRIPPWPATRRVMSLIGYQVMTDNEEVFFTLVLRVARCLGLVVFCSCLLTSKGPLQKIW